MFPQNIFPQILLFLAGFTITMVLGACATSTTTTGSQANVAVPPGAADKFLVVDCLLPGQIRKLGQSMIYLTARRPIKTSASDCEIRGGEYVAYDRANYATALKVWLPQAQAGDPKAQTYVGEIYEKGLGISPDYALAAQWYRKAADQGDSRAQIDLGFLYEQGLGVPQDKTKALNLYRKASGLTEEIAYSSTIKSVTAERDALRQQLALLQEQLDQTQEQLKSRRSRLEATQQELERTHRQLQQQRSTPSSTSSSNANTRQLEKQLAEQQALLAQQRQELAYLQQEAETQKAQLTTNVVSQRQEKEALQKQVEFLEDQLASYVDQLNNRKQALENQREKLDQVQRTLEQQSPTTPQNNAQLQRLQQQLEEKNKELATTREQIAQLETDVERREAELRAAQNQAKELQQDVAAQAREKESLQQQVEYLQKQLVDYRDRLNARKQQLEAQKESLEQAQLILERQSQIAASQDNPELQRVKQQLETNKQELNRTRAQVATLENEVERRRQELDKLKTLRAEQIALRRASTTIGSEVKPATPQPSVPNLDFGHFYALIIGNNRYTQFPNLETAVNDVQEVARVLKDHYGFETRVLTNANRYQILSALNEFRENLTEQDNFILYYAGHGELDRSNDRGYWLPIDAEPNSTANWISNVEITDILNAMNAKHVMVIADSCYSGTMARSIFTSIEGGRSDEKRRQWFELMIETRSRTVLTSGGLKPVLDTGGGGNHSVFAKALIDALRGNKGILEGPVLYQRVAKEVKFAASRLNIDQDPRYAPLQFAGDLGAPFFFTPVN